MQDLINSELEAFNKWQVEAMSSALLTPDIIELEQQGNHLVFVYNECQKGFKSNWLVEYDGVYCGTMFTLNEYTVFKKKLGKDTFPIALLEKWPRIEMSRVKGELWAISTDALKDLDDYMLNTVEFQRYREDLIYPHTIYWLDDQKKVQRSALKHSIHTAWMYGGIEDYWNLHIDGGFLYDVCRRFRLDKNEQTTFDYNYSEHFRILDYYAFSELEYEPDNTKAHSVP